MDLTEKITAYGLLDVTKWVLPISLPDKQAERIIALSEISRIGVSTRHGDARIMTLVRTSDNWIGIVRIGSLSNPVKKWFTQHKKKIVRMWPSGFGSEVTQWIDV